MSCSKAGKKARIMGGLRRNLKLLACDMTGPTDLIQLVTLLRFDRPVSDSILVHGHRRQSSV